MIVDLPPEMLQCIAAKLDSAAALNALVQTCTHVYQVLGPHVYQYDCQHGGSTALLWAAAEGHELTAQKSLAAHRLVRSAMPTHTVAEQALFPAADYGHVALVRLLLAVEGVDADARLHGGSGETALMRAAKSGHDEVVEVLLATRRVDVNAQDRWGFRPLLRAAAGPHEAVLRRLLDLPGVDAKVRDEHGWTALDWVAKHGRAALVELLLRHGVDPQPRDEDEAEHAPLFLAAVGGHQGVVDVLLRSGLVDLEAVDEDARTALTMAAWSGHAAVVQLLLAAGANADVKDAWEETPLCKAVQGGWLDVVEILLATEEVDRDSRDAGGRTPLSRAAEDGFIEVVRLLLAAGADRDIADDEGKMPLEWAEEYGNDILADLLRDGG